MKVLLWLFFLKNSELRVSTLKAFGYFFIFELRIESIFALLYFLQLSLAFLTWLTPNLIFGLTFVRLIFVLSIVLTFELTEMLMSSLPSLFELKIQVRIKLKSSLSLKSPIFFVPVSSVTNRGTGADFSLESSVSLFISMLPLLILTTIALSLPLTAGNLTEQLFSISIPKASSSSALISMALTPFTSTFSSGCFL